MDLDYENNNISRMNSPLWTISLMMYVFTIDSKNRKILEQR